MRYTLMISILSQISIINITTNVADQCGLPNVGGDAVADVATNVQRERKVSIFSFRSFVNYYQISRPLYKQRRFALCLNWLIYLA